MKTDSFRELIRKKPITEGDIIQSDCFVNGAASILETAVMVYDISQEINQESLGDRSDLSRKEAFYVVEKVMAWEHSRDTDDIYYVCARKLDPGQKYKSNNEVIEFSMLLDRGIYIPFEKIKIIGRLEKSNEVK